jgi:multiple sugar transport system substrate-binding protein
MNEDNALAREPQPERTWTRREVCRLFVVGGLASWACTAQPSSEKVKLTVLTHWGEESLLKPLQETFAAYERAHPNVTIEYQTTSFDQLLTKITSARLAGAAPDVYHVYNLWLPDFVKSGALATPPAEVLSDIKAAYSGGSVEGVSVGGNVWGYPTEVNTYQLIYNKKLLRGAGVDQAPRTWSDLQAVAAKARQADASGKVLVSGFTVMSGWDSGVVHPFLSLLWSNGGEYLSSDGSKTMFNSPQGLATLRLYVDMIKDKSVDLSIKMEDFVNGGSAMIIMANWWRATLKSQFKDGYDNVGVAPIPVGTSGRAPVALQYNWLWAVDGGTKHPKEAWELVRWLNSPAAEGASPMGDFLTSALGAIPSRTSDQKALAGRLNDAFLQTFLESTKTARPEPVVRGGQEVKTALQTDIEAAWFGKKPAEAALADAATKGDQILVRNR